MRFHILAALVAALTMTTGCKTATAVEPNAVHLTRLDTVESLIVGTGPVIDAALPMLTQAGATLEEVQRITRARQALQAATIEVIELVRGRLKGEAAPAPAPAPDLAPTESRADDGPDVSTLDRPCIAFGVHELPSSRSSAGSAGLYSCEELSLYGTKQPAALHPALYRPRRRLPRAPRALSPTAARDPETPRRYEALRL